MKKLLFPIMALIFIVGLALLIVLPAGATWTGNLLVNPGAETGDMTGWTTSLPPPSPPPPPPPPGVAALTSLNESCGWVYPNSGDYFFAMGFDSGVSPSWMKQTIDLTALGGTPVTFKAGGYVQTEKYWHEGWPNSGDPGTYDYGALFVEFFDSGDSSLGVFPLDPVKNPCCETLGVPHTYLEFSLTGAVPSGAASAVYKVEGYYVASVYINTFYDDLYFKVDVTAPPTPTPTPPPPVGGTIIPTDKSGLVMPWIIAAAVIAVAGVSLAVWNKKRGAGRASGC